MWILLCCSRHAGTVQADCRAALFCPRVYGILERVTQSQGQANRHDLESDQPKLARSAFQLVGSRVRVTHREDVNWLQTPFRKIGREVRIAGAHSRQRKFRLLNSSNRS